MKFIWPSLINEEIGFTSWIHSDMNSYKFLFLVLHFGDFSVLINQCDWSEIVDCFQLYHLLIEGS